jgi:hypothetical protein
MNAAISRRLGGPEEIAYVALPCGTALPVNDPVRLLLRGDTGGDVEYDEWRDFLAAHGV